MVVAVVLAVAAAVLGAAAGWFIGRMRLSRRVVESVRTTTELSAQLEAERARVAELEAELRAEQSLLDEVAARNRMTPRAFRETVARDYLHPADPHRRRHLDDDVIDLTDDRPQTIRPRNGDIAHSGSDLEAELADRERALDHIEGSLRQLRLDLEAILGGRVTGGSHRSTARSVELALPPVACELRVGPKVAELRDEVADLRRRLAERQLDADRLSHELASTQPDAGIRRLSAELADLRARVLDLQD